MDNEIALNVRRNIVNALTLEGIDFAGVKDAVEFLGTVAYRPAVATSLTPIHIML